MQGYNKGIVYFSIIMDRYYGPNTALVITLHRGHYLGIIMNRYYVPHTALTIALYRGFNLAIIMGRY
jgi:hypothetical protein